MSVTYYTGKNNLSQRSNAKTDPANFNDLRYRYTGSLGDINRTSTTAESSKEHTGTQMSARSNHPSIRSNQAHSARYSALQKGFYQNLNDLINETTGRGEDKDSRKNMITTARSTRNFTERQYYTPKEQGGRYAYQSGAVKLSDQYAGDVQTENREILEGDVYNNANVESPTQQTFRETALKKKQKENQLLEDVL